MAAPTANRAKATMLYSAWSVAITPPSPMSMTVTGPAAQCRANMAIPSRLAPAPTISRICSQRSWGEYRPLRGRLFSLCRRKEARASGPGLSKSTLACCGKRSRGYFLPFFLHFFFLAEAAPFLPFFLQLFFFEPVARSVAGAGGGLTVAVGPPSALPHDGARSPPMSGSPVGA